MAVIQCEGRIEESERKGNGGEDAVKEMRGTIIGWRRGGVPGPSGHRPDSYSGLPRVLERKKKTVDDKEESGRMSLYAYLMDVWGMYRKVVKPNHVVRTEYLGRKHASGANSSCPEGIFFQYVEKEDGKTEYGQQ